VKAAVAVEEGPMQKKRKKVTWERKGRVDREKGSFGETQERLLPTGDLFQGVYLESPGPGRGSPKKKGPNVGLRLKFSGGL